MMKKMMVSALMVVSLAGCGSTGVMTAAQAPSLGGQALAKKTPAIKAPANMDEAVFQKGLQAGLDQTDGKKAPLSRAAIDPNSYNYGYVMGLLQGSIKRYSSLSGDFNAKQFHAFAEMNLGALKDALAALKANEAMAPKYAGVIGILTSAIASYSSLDGEFNAKQFHNFADMNLEAMKHAFEALKAIQFD